MIKNYNFVRLNVWCASKYRWLALRKKDTWKFDTGQNATVLKQWMIAEAIELYTCTRFLPPWCFYISIRKYEITSHVVWTGESLVTRITVTDFTLALNFVQSSILLLYSSKAVFETLGHCEKFLLTVKLFQKLLTPFLNKLPKPSANTFCQL